jgi:RNA polymerase sigma factor (sigma-70 family)
MARRRKSRQPRKAKPRKQLLNGNRDVEIVKNIGLVHRVAQRFKQYCHNSIVSYEDLVQEGTVGLIIARDYFDPKRKVHFSTYANFWIEARIRRLLSSQYNTIHVTHTADVVYRELCKRFGNKDTFTADFAKRLYREYTRGKITYEDYHKFIAVLNAKSSIESRYIPIDQLHPNEDGGMDISTDSTQLGEKISASSVLTNAETDVLILERKSLVEKLLSTLDKKDAELLARYYGLCGYKPHTFEKLSKIFHRSKQSLHQCAKQLERKLKTRARLMFEDDKLDGKEVLEEPMA